MIHGLLLLFLLSPAKPFLIQVEKWAGSIIPFESLTIEASLIGNQIFEPLVKMSISGAAEPVLLQSWTVGEDQKTYFFKLKENVYFQNGELLTTEHIQKMVERSLKRGIVTCWDSIKGAKEFQSGKTKIIPGLKIIGPFEFHVVLNKPFPRFIQHLAEFQCFLTSLKNIRVPGYTGPTGTGPYQTSLIDIKNEKIVLTRNPHFVSKTPLRWETLVFGTQKTFGETTPDFSYLPPKTSEIERYNKIPYFDAQTYFLGMNADHPKLKSKEVRRFLGDLLSEGLIDRSLGAVNYKVTSFIPLGLSGYSTVKTPPLAKKPAALPAAVTLSYYLSRLAPLAENYCAVLIKNKIDCKPEQVSLHAILEAKTKNTLNIFLVRFRPTTPSAEDMLSTFRSHSELNLFQDVMPEADIWFDKIFNTPPQNPEALKTLYQEFDVYIRSEGWVKPFRYGGETAVYLLKEYAPPEVSSDNISSFPFGTLEKR